MNMFDYKITVPYSSKEHSTDSFLGLLHRRRLQLRGATFFTGCRLRRSLHQLRRVLQLWLSAAFLFTHTTAALDLAAAAAFALGAAAFDQKKKNCPLPTSSLSSLLLPKTAITRSSCRGAAEICGSHFHFIQVVDSGEISHRIAINGQKPFESLSKEIDLDHGEFKEIERCSTHTVLAACGLEHRRKRACTRAEMERALEQRARTRNPSLGFVGAGVEQLGSRAKFESNAACPWLGVIIPFKPSNESTKQIN
ncbi:hypothetical protein NL676_036044 [Syzygium grande]|nr:hypothetical protein NL676_036044 [Syzygium grande]